MGEIAETCNLDVDPGEEARALHRIVRAMHDGHCPECGHLAPAEAFNNGFGHSCPRCDFRITKEQEKAALARFRPFLQASLAIFEKWRKREFDW